MDNLQDKRGWLEGLTAMFDRSSVKLKASPTGILAVAGPRLVDVFHWVSTGVGTAFQGPNIPCTEVLIRAHPDNTARVWVRNFKAATVNNAIPLDKGEAVVLSLENLNQLYAMTAGATDKIVVAYSL